MSKGAKVLKRRGEFRQGYKRKKKERGLKSMGKDKCLAYIRQAKREAERFKKRRE